VAILAIIAMAIVLSMNAGAATADIEPEQEFTDTVGLHKGETVRWAWTARQFDLGFDIKDPDGDIAYVVNNEVTDTGTLTATISGDWTFNWQNGLTQDPSYDHTITLDYTITVLNSPPIVHIVTNVTSGIVPLSVTLNGSGTDPDGTVASYSWDLGDGGTASTMNVIHIYTAVGTYAVNLTCTDDDGAKGYAEVVITVLPVNPTVTHTTPAQGASGVALDVQVVVEFSLPMVRADVQSKTSITPTATFTLSWSNGDRRATVTFGQALEEGMTYALTIGRANATNGGRLAQPFSLSFSTLGVPNVPPTASISANATSGIAPLAVNFTGTGTDTDGTIASYLWQFGDGTTATTQNATHTYPTPGTYTVNLTVTDDRGAHGSAEVEITALPVDPVVVSFYPANNAVGVPVIVDIAVNFSLPMSRSDLQARTTIVPAATMTLSWSDSDRKVSISFTQDLQYLTRYTLTIGRANATNGGQLAAPFVVSFTTKAQEIPMTVRIIAPLTGTTVKQGATVTLTGDSTGIPQGTNITVTFGDVTKKAVIGADGKWSVEFTAPAKSGEFTVKATYLDATYTIKVSVEEKTAAGGSPMLWIVLVLAIIISAVLVFLLLGRKGSEPEPAETVPPEEAAPEGEAADENETEELEKVETPPAVAAPKGVSPGAGPSLKPSPAKAPVPKARASGPATADRPPTPKVPR
jgi:PKD repeat protein